ncbi:RNA exonuclease 1 homolog [Gadus chalcogrammus]|uniref:RNA exonuclease 1 homolog n=1 Tax=Gadus chalcogrammus TaxID=1042646 RepID=UPI0024C4BDCC|nr:RNA exonuclease 1 homolog [Gadus chalcogrammus]XP_056459409.1 RNA exonuclease 1 homolog [Gadus chalcogrammus]XP_056459410.1 RNA exonuclease 1 homolog [Gadus chalcogrammus]
MLRSTGFFRGLECPFYSDSTELQADRQGCNRPYCHFRHSRQRRASHGAAVDSRKQRVPDSKLKDQAYDPFNPEVVSHKEPQDGEDLSGALELVNQAIKEVQNEVEREKRKLSRMGDDEYEPTSNRSLSTVEAVKKPIPKAVTSHLAYDPGSYQMTSSEYNPTPSCSKYTLDVDVKGANSMEYVPTSKRKPSPRTQATRFPSLPTPTYSSSASSKGKYTLDNSKPTTDMEYDPLSNYSARIAGKHKKEESIKENRASAKARRPSTDKEYVPTAKRPCPRSADTQKYTCSDTDEESSGTEYRPTSLHRLKRREGSAAAAGRRDPAKGPEPLPQRGREGAKEQTPLDPEGCESRPPTDAEKERLPAKPSHSKTCKSEKTLKGEKTMKAVGGKVSSSDNGRKEKSSANKSSNECVKKDGQSSRKREDKRKGKEASPKVARELQEEKRDVGRSKAVERLQGDSSKERAKGRENGVEESKKAKVSDKHKDHQHNNGKHESSKRVNDVRKNSKNSSNTSSKSTSNSSHGKTGSDHSKVRHQSNAPEAGKVKEKRRAPSLSHADLFGDESPDGAGADESDEDGEEQGEVLVRKSADALKRRRVLMQPLKAPSSEEEEEGLSMEDGQAEMDFCGVDLSLFQGDLDFDSDPMEECLRIFNESKDVKKEDKGRQAKQPCRDSEEEEEGSESPLTGLFPGQRKRVSHFAVQGSVEGALRAPVRPSRRPTAQEICYQRLQMAQQQAEQLAQQQAEQLAQQQAEQLAQQQAEQLAAAVRSTPVKTPGVRTPGVRTPGVRTPGVRTPGARTPGARTPLAPPSSSLAGERKRVAHRPSLPGPSSSQTVEPAASRVLSPNRTLPAHLSVRAQTSAGILSKTTSTVVQKRLAHTPTMKSSSLKRPVIPTEFGAKVPTNVRQRYLHIFIDECVKFCPSEEAAFHMALDEEKVVYDRSSSKNIYLNVAVNTLKKLRGKSGAPPAPPPKAVGSAAHRRTMTHEEVLGGRMAATTSFTLNRTGRQSEEQPCGAALYRKLKAYLMTEEQLQEHGYPRASAESSGRAVIHNQPERKALADAFSKTCCRCGAEYKVNVKGSCVRREECNHHWGRLRRNKGAGGWETNYNCCSGPVGTPGCQVSKQHVQDGRKESVEGYVKTFSKALPPDGDGGVYALDCEMCYTKQGLELTRVTVVNAELKVIYDTFVKPESKVVDYNTRFSGVTEEDLDNTTITLRDVQAVLLSMFSAESILLGHSLESDLLALKVIHSTVIDTSIVFPHRIGLPYKRALRNLMADHLKRIIQDNVDGHDSSEDASACMQLMFWKLKEDAKVKR